VCTVFYVQHQRIPKTVLFSAVVTVDQYKEVNQSTTTYCDACTTINIEYI